MTLKERIKTAKEESPHHKNQEQKRWMHHFSQRNRRYLWRVLQETLRRQWKKQLCARREWWKKRYLKSRLKNYKEQSASSNLANLLTEMEYELKTIKDCNDKTKRNDETDRQRGYKKEQLHAWRMEESENKSDLQERWRRGCKQLPPNLLTAFDVQTVLDNNVRKIIPNAWPISSRRSGGIQKNLPNNGSSCDVQNAGTKMSGVENQNVDSDGGWRHSTPSPHNSIWEALLSCNVEHGYVCLLKKFTKIRRHHCRRTKRAKFSISKKVPNRAIHCQACSSTRCCSMH